MRRFLTLIMYGVSLCLFGYLTIGSASANDVSVNSEAVKPLIKCSTCGVEFTSQAGLVEHLKSHPDHQAAPSDKPLIKCSTCGVEFTSDAGVADHIKANPAHKVSAMGSAAHIIKCSTCGVEFTSREGMDEHMKTHPGH
jgi:DNA-directed RNA polymerase subunit RPC12/RpoP